MRAGQTSWRAVRDEIHARILNRTYGPGDKLPRDEDFAAELGCARSTVQRAMRDLSDAGIVERRRKGGTHVRADPVTRATLDIPITRAEVEGRGGVYGYRLIRQRLVETPSGVVAGFGLTRPERMLRVEALHLADGRPYIFEDRWISTQTSPEILEVDLSEMSANEWLVRHKPYSRGRLRFHATEADGALARVLEAREGAALFVLERTTWIGEAPITLVRAVAAPGYALVTEM